MCLLNSLTVRQMSPCVSTRLTGSWTDATVPAVRYICHRQVEAIGSSIDGLQAEGVVGAWLQGVGGDDDLRLLPNYCNKCTEMMRKKQVVVSVRDVTLTTAVA